MPAGLIAILPAIAAIAGIGGTALTIGEDIAHSGSSSGPTKPTVPTGPTQQQSDQTKALISQQLPNVIGQTSGLAGSGYDELIAQILSGVTGQPGAGAAATGAGNQTFTAANSQPTNAVVNNQPPNISDFLSNFTA